MEKEEPLEVIFESAAMSQLYFTKLRLFLDYLLTDIAELRKDKGVNDDEEEIEIEGQDPDLDQIKQLVQLDDLEKLTLLKAIHGIIKAVMMKKLINKVEFPEKKKKKSNPQLLLNSLTISPNYKFLFKIK